MPFPFAAIGAVLTGASAIFSILGGRKAGKAARRAADEEARLEGLVTAAKIEDLRREEKVLRGETISAAAGAGVKVDVGSPLEILAEQAREFAREREVVGLVGATRSQQARERGQMLSSQARYQSYTQAFQGFGSMFSILAGK